MLTPLPVARARTFEALELRPDLDPARLKGEITNIVQSVPQPPAGLDREGLHQYVGSRLREPLAALGMNNAYIAVEERESTLVSAVVAGNPNVGFTWLHLFVRLVGNQFMFYEPLTISPHAIERCMQRTGSMSFDDMHEYFSQAFGSAIPLMSVGLREGWQQCAAPVRDGVFVGSIGDGGLTWHMDTFISRKAHEPESRWDRFKGLFPAFPDWPHEDRRCIEVVGNWMNEQLQRITAHAPIASRVRFLRRPYTPGVDRDASAWAASPSKAQRVDPS
ncbi:hypothetical protein [Burkholderia vietnamiensis]|uniref:hypothetical protein n=1 Tax=Burkholderia vietnamiensis TaxID=60552 RepID=UPI000A487992|nr:hypothetical protein [Burkholderia vietnamiensis]MCA8291839.1 hypothetical protein [Burkholderia vietnamiensis]